MGISSTQQQDLENSDDYITVPDKFVQKLKKQIKYMAGGETHFRNLEKEILEAQNALRTDPQSLIPILEKQIKNFDGHILWNFKNFTFHNTQEGPQAYKEAIEYLRYLVPVDELKESKELSNCARQHSNDIGPEGIVGHIGIDGVGYEERIKRFVEYKGNLAESFSHGLNSGADILTTLIVDEGIEGRGNRLALFDQYFKQVGIGCGEHAKYMTMCTINYADNVSPLDENDEKQEEKVIEDE